MDVAPPSMAEKARCPDCDGILTALYRQRRVGGKLTMPKAPWIECERCKRVFPVLD